MEKIRFGIIGTGDIAAKFATACSMVSEATAYAVSSRDIEKANTFAAKNGVGTAYGSYEELVCDPEIDAVYVATPHSVHFDHCMLALRNNKHVLCEKPMVMREQDAKVLFDYAQKQNLFMMEGMWTRFLPNIKLAKRWIDEGKIGKIKFIDMEFSSAIHQGPPKDRLVNPALGGGGLYDVGVYTIEMASFFAGANPLDYSGYCTDFCAGVDATTVMAAKYPNHILATLRTGIVCDSPCLARIIGEKGSIEIPYFYVANDVRLIIGGEIVDYAHQNYPVAEGLSWQLKEVCGYINDGVTESETVPHRDTVATAGILENMMNRFYGDQNKPSAYTG
jgi:dihydrodiol dehydrogenase / D-xylose 1-dehydrogenase (NADP)